MRAEGPAVAEHGGDIAAIAERYGVDARSLLDFSVNVNPLGPPAALLRELAEAANDVVELARYPEADAAPLRTALSTFLDVEPEAIVVGNGAAALLETALLSGVRRCVVPIPAFSEYRRALNALGAELVAVPLDPAANFALEAAHLFEALRASDAQACIVTNPHNPSGALTSVEVVRAVRAAARTFGARTIVDEAFIDYAPHASIAPDAVRDAGLIVVRSLTKFFAVPALRVGYAVCAPEVARQMRARLPSWPVTTLAMRAVAAALSEATYADATRRHNERERRDLGAALARLGIHVFPSAANFLLLDVPARGRSSREVTHELIANARLVVRDTSSYDGLGAGCFVRVAVRGRDDNARLVAAFANLLQPGVRSRGDDYE